ncbi:MAG: phospholipase D family protein [Caldilineaceae bacterium]|nr:phospholipase D family protein [Caldilineaceae bacterium]
MKTLILQAVTDQHHLSALQDLLAMEPAGDIILSSAFVTEAGLSLLADALEPVAHCTTLFAGIRNGITTAQGLARALALGCTLHVVDTGSRTPIFHTKLYFHRNEAQAQVIVGSANLTVAGLTANIEASLYQELDLAVGADAALAAQIDQRFRDMPKEFPEHVLRIDTQDQIETLLQQGRVMDEDRALLQPPAPAPGHERTSGFLPRMRLRTHAPRKAGGQRRTATKSRTRERQPAPAGDLELLWESPPLKRRDLNIPTSAKTNPTGSMLWKKGQNDIDPKHYFRHQVFQKLEWRPHPRIQGKEMAEAHFQLVVGGVDCGVYRLTLSHDTRTDTASYRQNQPMSSLHWGAAKPFVAREELLDRTLRLYRHAADFTTFVIDID